MQKFWEWLKSLFITYYKLSVSYNATWGDKDDQIFLVRKFYVKKEKHLKFKTKDVELVRHSYYFLIL